MRNKRDDTPLVTVVTMTFKKFDGIFDTIESVIEQDYPNIEYIIADDGSQNFPHENIVSFFKGKEFVDYYLLENGTNQGTVKNINNAYKHAHGDFFVNLSCGDVFYSVDSVSLIIERMLKLKSDVLVTTRIVFSERFKPLYYLPHRIDIKTIKRWNSREKQYKAFVTSSFLNMASGSAMHFSRKAIESVGYFDERYILWEDGPFIEKYLRSNYIQTAYDIISIWYEDGGISNSGMNPILHNDSVLFSQTDRLFKYNHMTVWDKMKIDYRSKSLLCTGTRESILNKIRYFPVFIYFSYQWLRNLIGIKVDKRLLSKTKK